MSKLVFKTKEEAIEFLRKETYLHEHSKGFSPKGTYYLRHGEYSAPDFKRCAIKTVGVLKKSTIFTVGHFIHR